VPAVWHWPGAAHEMGLLCTHAPLLHATVCMQRFVIAQAAHVAPLEPQLVADCIENGSQVDAPEQQPEHDVESQTQVPAALQCSPEPEGQLPLVPVHVPPAPSEPPHATPMQLVFLQTPWSRTSPALQATAKQLP